MLELLQYTRVCIFKLQQKIRPEFESFLTPMCKRVNKFQCGNYLSQAGSEIYFLAVVHEGYLYGAINQKAICARVTLKQMCF